MRVSVRVPDLAATGQPFEDEFIVATGSQDGTARMWKVGR